VAIVGVGPRGLSVLERLMVRLSDRSPARHVLIWTIDPVELTADLALLAVLDGPTTGLAAKAFEVPAVGSSDRVSTVGIEPSAAAARESVRTIPPKERVYQ
jgi:hypothetical protein